MKIEILGTGCPKCEALKANAETAMRELGLEADVSKVSDIVEIADRGALVTPALSVNGKIVLAGKGATVDELKALLSSNKGSRELI